MRLFAAALAALALAACQDPAGVGLGLIDEEQLDPNVRVLPLDGLTVFDDSTIAIGIADANNQALSQPRVLAGAVVDPVFGDARAIAYLDFLRNGDIDSADPADVSEVWLELNRAYVYGDTLTELPLDLRAITDEWDADRDYPVDTLLAVGDVLSTTTVTVADTLTRFDLPEAWVRANAAALVSDTFTDDFDGLALSVSESFTASPGAVFGFDTFQSQGSGLRVVVDDDTLAFALSEVFSSVASSGSMSTEILPARATSRAGVAFRIDLGEVGRLGLARARLRLPIRADLAEEGTFRRPIAEASFLFGVRGEGDDRVRDFLGALSFEDGDDELTIDDTQTLTASIQAALLDGDEAYDRYEIVVNPAAASLDVIPLLLPGAASERDPRLTLTLVGQ